MEEEKKVKETKTKKTSAKTIKSSAKTKKETETKSKDTSELTIENISPALMEQMFKIFKQMQSINNTETVSDEVIDEKPKKITKSYLRKIKDKEIVVKSVAGVVSFKSPKTNILYKWTEIGDEEVLTVDEILTMDSTSRRFLNTPWLVIDDKEVIEGLGLSNLYETIEKVEDVDNLLSLEIDEIEEVINKAPYEYKKTLAGVIFEKVNNKELRDMVVIKELERILGTTLLL